MLSHGEYWRSRSWDCRALRLWVRWSGLRGERAQVGPWRPQVYPAAAGASVKAGDVGPLVAVAVKAGYEVLDLVRAEYVALMAQAVATPIVGGHAYSPPHRFRDVSPHNAAMGSRRRRATASRRA